MDFQLSAEQEMLRDGARRFITDNLHFDKRTGKDGAMMDHWPALAEMGWLMLPVPEDCEGLGGRVEEIAILAEELGRGLSLEPFAEAALLPAALIDRAGAPDQRRALLAALAAGELRFAAALSEPRHGFSLWPVETIARVHGGRLHLSGAKVGIEGAAKADRLVVSAVLADKVVLLAVPCGVDGIERLDYAAIDGRTLSDFIFDDVAIEQDCLLGAGRGDASSAILRAVDHVIVAQCAEAVGSMDRAIELTADYLGIRRQFGQPLANFQALQHGVADMFIEANDARSILYRAISRIHMPPEERMRAVSACKVKVMEAARSVIGKAVHYHGGIGVTTEYSVGHYLLRILLLDQRFGNGSHHFERIMAACG